MVYLPPLHEAIRDAIDALGGPGPAARQTGITRPVLDRWRGVPRADRAAGSGVQVYALRAGLATLAEAAAAEGVAALEKKLLETP